MDLTEDQKRAIAGWIEAGAGLSDIQKRLKEEFGIALTYLETRLLADDLKLAFREPERPAEPASPLVEQVPQEPEETGAVRVTIDQITRPGAVLSGRVTFSDGAKAEWYLDAAGRLGLLPDQPGYRPSQKDFLDFQVELERVARAEGL